MHLWSNRLKNNHPTINTFKCYAGLKDLNDASNVIKFLQQNPNIKAFHYDFVAEDSFDAVSEVLKFCINVEEVSIKYFKTSSSEVQKHVYKIFAILQELHQYHNLKRLMLSINDRLFYNSDSICSNFLSLSSALVALKTHDQ